MISLLDDETCLHLAKIEGAWEWVEAIEAPVLPEVPPECHNRVPVDAERAIRAVRSLCGG